MQGNEAMPMSGDEKILAVLHTGRSMHAWLIVANKLSHKLRSQKKLSTPALD